MKHSLDDTIAAIATPPGVGGVGIVRISGQAAISLLNKLFHPSKDLPIESHYLYRGLVKAPGKENAVDQALACYMKSPNSFTGEDVVEIHCHGGEVVLKQVLNLAIKEGARLAERGEFTKRAFLNGKIDLLQAEAVIDLVRARTEWGSEIAVEQLTGKLSKMVRNIKQEIMNLTVRLEAEIDFPDDIEETDINKLSEEINKIEVQIEQLLATGEEGRVVREGVRLAIVGRPNVGKSSLLNALLGEERAIVTEIPGTTSDTIEEGINMEGIPFVVIDTAGIREHKTQIERLGIERTREEIKHADFIIIIVDGSEEMNPDDNQLINEVKGRKGLLAINKIDLGRVGSDSFSNSSFKGIQISAKTGQGIAALKKAVVEEILPKGALGERLNLCINNRHKQVLIRAEECLKMARESCNIKAPMDCIAIDLRGAIRALEEVSGEAVSEEIINEIFSGLCVGK